MPDNMLLNQLFVAAAVSLAVATFFGAFNALIDKIFGLDLRGVTGLPKKHLVWDALVAAAILFLLQSIFIFTRMNSLFIVLVFVSILTLYPSLIQPYRLLRRGTFRDRDLEKWIREQTHIEAVVLVSPKKFVNALAFGVLPALKIIIISEALREGMTTQHLHGILLHEAGHLKSRHVTTIALFSVVAACLQTILLTFMLRADMPLRHPFTYFSSLGACASLLYFLPAPLYRLMELRADSFAAHHVGPKVYADALRRLDELSGGAVTNSDFYHPQLKKRIENVSK